VRGENDTLAVKKSDVSGFERGFKTWCENIAESTRERLDLRPYAPLSPRELAQNMGVTILDFSAVQGLDPASAHYLTSQQGDEWSAVTVHAAGKQIIVVNPRHSEARQASNIMHELAHLIRGHKPSQVQRYQGYTLRDFKPLQENEANWLAGCLLLPRRTLLHIGYNGIEVERAVELYGVSKSLYKYRVGVSGVSKQLRYVRP